MGLFKKSFGEKMTGVAKVGGTVGGCLYIASLLLEGVLWGIDKVSRRPVAVVTPVRPGPEVDAEFSAH